MKSAIIAAAMTVAALFAGPAAGDTAPAPAEIGRRLVDNLLGRGHMYYGDEALHYSEAATAVGALRFAALVGDEDAARRLRNRYAALLDDDGPLLSRRPHVDLSVIGIVPLRIAMQTGDAAYLKQGLSFADNQWADPLPDGLTRQSRYWIDDLYMVGMLQIEAFRATGNRKYADRAALQLATYLPVLQQDNGLFFHSPDVPIFWGRGNGWVASALAEVLASLPDDQENRPFLLGRYRKMMSTLLAYQRGDGMWRQVIDVEQAWPESSATAMFAYAMAAGIENGLLPASEYRPAIYRAWRGLAGYVDADGNVGQVCIGTGKKNDLQYYLDRPRASGDFHGQAPVLWLATELLRLETGA